MRLLHIYGGNLYGGVERLLASLQEWAPLAPDLDQRFALCYQGRLARELSAHGASVHALGEVHASRPWQVLGARRQLRRWIEHNQIQAAICHSWWPYAVFAPAARRAGIPVGLWVHETTTGRGWLERWAGRRRPDFLLTWGTGMAAALHRLFPQPAAEILGPPVPIPPPLSTAARAAARAQQGAASGDVVLLQASRFEPWKGHGLLIEALARLRDLPSWQLWVAGGAQRPHEAAYGRALRTRAAQLGLQERIHWLGERTDVSRLMQAADIFCQPNTEPEPYGVVFLEALAAGLPVVATAPGGATEIITPACGYLTAPEPAAVAGALRACITNPGERRRLAAAGPDRARELSDPARQMRRYQSLVLEGTR